MVAADRFLDVVQAFVDEPIGADLLGVDGYSAIASMRDGTFAMVLSAKMNDAEALEAGLREFVAETRGSDLKLVIVGGDAAMRALLERVQPAMMMGRVIQVFALDDAGVPWVGARTRLDSPVGVALAAAGARTEPRAVELTALRSRVHRPSPDEAAHAADVHAFVQSTRRGTPVATFTVLGLIAAAFGLEWLWGGTEFVPTLVRMGANDRDALGAEPWRLLSSAWLHAGPLHVLVNSYVLFSLGGLLERLLGAPRLIVLYVAAAAAGGIASAALSNAALSVGASGAIWGLLGASLALAWRPAGLIPPAVLPMVRRNAMVNVVINLAVSFLPAVDIMAHLGGGIVGAAAVSLGLLTRGVAEPAAASRRRWWIAAGLASTVMVASPIVAIVVGQPWAIFAPGTTAHALGEGATIEAPTALGEVHIERMGTRTEVTLGDPFHDRAALTVAIERHDGVIDFPEGLERQFAEFRDAPMPPPDGGVQVGPRVFLQGPRSRSIAEHYSFEGGVELLVVFGLHTSGATRLEAQWSAAHPELEAELLAAAESLTLP